MAKQQDRQFKLDAIQYYENHKDLGVRGCAENLGVGYSPLTKWMKDFRESGLNGANPGQSPRKILISARNYRISWMGSLILIARMWYGVWTYPVLLMR